MEENTTIDQTPRVRFGAKNEFTDQPIIDDLDKIKATQISEKLGVISSEQTHGEITLNRGARAEIKQLEKQRVQLAKWAEKQLRKHPSQTLDLPDIFDRQEANINADEERTRNQYKDVLQEQKPVTVSLGELGNQTTQYVELHPKSPELQHLANSRPDVVLIPGFVNDIESLDKFARDLANSGRNVHFIGMPGSSMSTVTEAYVQKFENSTDFGPLVDYYKALVDHFTQDDKQVQLWGHSTGGAIALNIAADPIYSKKLTDVIAMNPASSAELTRKQMEQVGPAKDFLHALKRHAKKLPFFTFVTGKKDGKEEGQQAFHTRIINSLMEKVGSPRNRYQDARVQEGGKIIIFSGGKDKMTNSSLLFNDNPQQLDAIKDVNPQIKIIYDKQGIHNDAVINGEHVIGLIEPQLQKAA